MYTLVQSYTFLMFRIISLKKYLTRGPKDCASFAAAKGLVVFGLLPAMLTLTVADCLFYIP